MGWPSGAGIIIAGFGQRWVMNKRKIIRVINKVRSPSSMVSRNKETRIGKGV